MITQYDVDQAMCNLGRKAANPPDLEMMLDYSKINALVIWAEEVKTLAKELEVINRLHKSTKEVC